MSLAKLRIEPIDGSPIRCNIYLDDVDIGKYVCGFKIIRESVSDAPIVELKLRAQIDIADLPVVLKDYKWLLDLAYKIDWHEVAELKKIPVGLKAVFAELHNIRFNSDDSS